MSLEELVLELVIQHPCVILPDFGGFVTQPVSATIDITTGMMYPPSKKVLFNKNLIQNDGLLVHHFATKNQINFADAQTQVQIQIQQINNQIQRSKVLEFGQIGTFQLDADGILRFEQNRYFNFLLSAHGLKQMLVFIPKAAIKQEEIPSNEPEIVLENERVGDTISNDQKVRKVNFKKLAKYAAAAAIVLPIAFYSFWIPTQTSALEGKMISLKDFNPFSSKEVTVYTKKKITLPEKIEVEKEEQAVKAIEIPDEVAEVKIVESTKPAVSNVKFHFIVGCFASEANANNLVAQLKAKGFDGQIVPGGNLIRVSAGAANNQESLNALTQKANNSGWSGWVLK